MSHMASTSAVTLEKYEQQRKEVRERHSQSLGTTTVSGEKSKKGSSGGLRSSSSIRGSELWRKYCSDSLRHTESTQGTHEAAELAPSAHPQPKLGPNYILEEETVRNDYSQEFVDSGCGVLPSTSAQNPSLEGRFKEYPRLRRLVELQNHFVESCAHPPTYLNADLLTSLTAPPRARHSPSNIVNGRANEDFHLNHLMPVKYDVILIDPPLECYEWEGTPLTSSLRPATSDSSRKGHHYWSWDQVAALPIPQLAAKESFVFLWVGSGGRNGLEKGREILARWGYRRCEDICWLAIDSEEDTDPSVLARQEVGWNIRSSTSSGLSRSVQHCLMGIRGTVRRSTDGNFVHCNIDTDVILWPQSKGADRVVSKPPELHNLIENFCLGTRRIELFGRNRNLRRGWLTVGTEVGPDSPDWEEFQSSGGSAIAYDKAVYDTFFRVDPAGCELKDRQNLVPYSAEVDSLRPKTPPRGQQENNPNHFATNMSPGRAHTSLQGAYPPPPNELLAEGGISQGGHGTNRHPATSQAGSPRPPGNGLSGLGAGGPKTVSILSGSETLSGPQASVLGLKGAPTRAGPSGLGRNMPH